MLRAPVHENFELAVLIRPDRVIAEVAAGRRLPEMPWPIRPPGAQSTAAATSIRPDHDVPAIGPDRAARGGRSRLEAAMFVAISILLILACAVPAGAKLAGAPAVRESADHFGIPWSRYRLISVPELAAAAGVLAGLWLHPLGVAAACGMAVLLIAAIVMHGRARDDVKAMAPALISAVITAAYLIIALTG